MKKKKRYTYFLIALILLLALLIYTPTNDIVGIVQKDPLFYKKASFPTTWVYVMPCVATVFCPEELTILKYSTAQARYGLQMSEIARGKRKKIDPEVITQHDSLRAEFLKILAEHRSDDSIIKFSLDENETFSISKSIGRYVVYAFYDSTMVEYEDFWLTYFDTGRFIASVDD